MVVFPFDDYDYSFWLWQVKRRGRKECLLNDTASASIHEKLLYSQNCLTRSIFLRTSGVYASVFFLFYFRVVLWYDSYSTRSMRRSISFFLSTTLCDGTHVPASRSLFFHIFYGDRPAPRISLSILIVMVMMSPSRHVSYLYSVNFIRRV